jgi:hypothetical protein
LVAQCAPGAPCELPTGLPWYFGLAVALVWLAAVVGALLLGRRMLVRRIRARRERAAGDHRALEQTSSGHDLERW